MRSFFKSSYYKIYPGYKLVCVSCEHKKSFPRAKDNYDDFFWRDFCMTIQKESAFCLYI